VHPLSVEMETAILVRANVTARKTAVLRHQPKASATMVLIMIVTVLSTVVTRIAVQIILVIAVKRNHHVTLIAIAALTGAAAEGSVCSSVY